MSKFKVGDRVRALEGTGHLTCGGEYTVRGVDDDDVLIDILEPLGSPKYLSYPHDWFELVQIVQAASPSPVRTKTVKEIVPGEYGPVHVGYNLTAHGYVSVSLASSVFNADGLSDIINTLTPIRDALADALEA